MKLRFFYKIDKTSHPVPFSNIKRKSKPFGGKWKEVKTPCCDPTKIGCTCDFRYFIQIDTQGRLVDASLIKRKNYPESVGDSRYMELSWNECCDTSTVPELPELMTIDAGNDILVTGATEYTINMTTSSDADIASIVWSQVSGASTADIQNSTTASPTVLGLIENEPYVFQVVVTDIYGRTITDTIQVTTQL